MSSHSDVRGTSRRQFVRRALGAAALGLAAPARILVAAAGAQAPGRNSPDVPEAALEELLAGNRRYTSNRLTSFERDLKALRERTEAKQEPFAAVLACADSRVPVELVFDQSIGRLFVVRVAGNIVAPEIIASLEYAVAELGVRAVLVLGHTHCGAVKAAMKSESAPGQISALYPHLRPAVERSGGSIEKAVRINAALQGELLRTASTVIGKAVGERKLVVAVGVYDLATGRVSLA